MYTELSLYYLNQLGITPWVIRRYQKVKDDTTKMIVLIDAPLSSKEKRLLKQMIYYLDLDKRVVRFITLDHKEEADSLISNHEEVIPINLTSSMLSSPWVNEINLKTILKDPRKKKQTLQCLSQLLDHERHYTD